MTEGQLRYLSLLRGGPLPVKAFRPPKDPKQDKLDEILQMLASMQNEQKEIRVRPRVEFTPG